MKLTKWCIGALACTLFAACSDNDIANDPSKGSSQFETTSGAGYIGVTLQLPEEAATRGKNDVFEDGIAAEYAVNNAALLLFWGNKEEDAEFYGAYKIGSDERFDMPNGDNITTSFQNVATINRKPTGSGQLWGLAIVNYDPSIFKIGGKDDTASEAYGSLTINAKKTDETTGALTGPSNIVIPVKTKTTAGMKFKDFRLLVTTAGLYNKSDDNLNIFMSNAPLSDKKGMETQPTNYTIQTLSKLDVSKIYDQRETAKTNPAGCIFVERAVAKVTVSKFPKEATLKYQQLTQTDDGTVSSVGTEPADVKLTVKSVSCKIDNEEKDSYFVRNAQYDSESTEATEWGFWASLNQNYYRFIGQNGMMDKSTIGDNANEQFDEATDNHRWYRTYWCKDPNYSTDKEYWDQANSNDFPYVNLLDSKGNIDQSIAFYPRENTFSLANQNYKNTTRVVFKVQYEWKDNAGDDITVYCKKNDPSIIYKQDDARMFLKEAFITSNALHEIILTYVDGEKAVTNGIATKNASGGYNINYNLNHFVFDYDVTSDKLYVIKSVEFADGGALKNSLKAIDAAVMKNIFNSAIKDVNDEVNIRVFNNNVCYYAAYIKHFGDEYCKMPDDYKGDNTADVYNGEDAKYLGRWGLVRNNWYDLSIDLVQNMGFANVPNGNFATSDDNNTEEFYLSARVHILSWAKRTQQTNF